MRARRSRSQTTRPRSAFTRAPRENPYAGQEIRRSGSKASQSDGGSPIVDYQLETSSDAGTTWAAVTDDASAANSAAITGLVNDTAYVFRVRAVSDVGTSNWSPTSLTARTRNT